MNIISTTIPDIGHSNLDVSKIELSNTIINNIQPLFYEVYNDRNEEIEILNKTLNAKKEKVLKEKDTLEGLVKEYNRKKKIKKLIERISKLVSSGLTHDNNLKKEIIVLLKIVDKLPEEKLDFQLQQTMKYINKRFIS